MYNRFADENRDSILDDYHGFSYRMVGLEDVSNIYDFINNYPDDDEKEQVEQCLKDIDDFYDDIQYLNDKYRYLFIPFKDREDFDRCCVNI